MIKGIYKRKGSGYLIVLAFAGILLILFMVFGTLKSGQQQLQSNDVRRFIATTLAETGLNCIISELNANRAFCTHRYYREIKDLHWNTPIKNRETLLGDMGNIYVKGVSNGIYSGGSEYGEFKAKAARVFGARESSKTKTLLEGEMYYRAEVAVKIGGGWGNKNESCRKITAYLERRFPATENLLYDGELLDLGSLGPYSKRENILRRGRLYGHNMITFNTAGGSCRGSEFYEMEKIETPGFIRALTRSRIGFSDNSRLDLSATNDSLKISEFDPRDGYILDGANGAHPIKLTRLPRERIKATAHRYRKTYGVTLEEGTLPYGEYKNPYDPKTRYVDLDFGKYKIPSKKPDDDEDENEENNSSSSNTYITSDDPEIIRKLRNDKILVYSEVPLRIWGCPDRTITIYSTKDIVIAGDFNQNEKTPQMYKDEYYSDYKFKIETGRTGHKVGALIMSDGRILIDTSYPTIFAKNEIAPYFYYRLAKALNPSTPEVEAEIKNLVCPINPENRQSLVGISGEIGSDGNFLPRFGTMKWLHESDPSADSKPQYKTKMEDVIAFFTPGSRDIPRFGIQDSKIRDEIIETLKAAIRNSGCDLTRDEQQSIFDMAWKQAITEEQKSPDFSCGAMGLINGLFEEAIKDPNDALYIPEITINAALVSSTRRASYFKIGNNKDKVNDEIGNGKSFEYLRSPGYIIQRVYGSVARLASKEPEYFISGEHTGKAVLRRRIWDDANLKNNPFRPLESPTTHNILTFREEIISEKEYNNFSGNN